jgi:hypothetical protein
MHLRLSTVRRGDKTYRYAQLVESYRREEDGRPVPRMTNRIQCAVHGRARPLP